MNSIEFWKTINIDGFNVRFPKRDLDYFRIITENSFERYSAIQRVKHDKCFFGLNAESRNMLQTIIWGGIPIWWKEADNFNGIPIYFIRTNKLARKEYKNSKFFLIPINSIIERIASDFKVHSCNERQFWCIGIGWAMDLTYGVALLQKPNQTLITIPEHKVREHYRSKYYDIRFNHLMREELKRYVDRIVLDRVVVLKESFYD